MKRRTLLKFLFIVIFNLLCMVPVCGADVEPVGLQVKGNECQVGNKAEIQVILEKAIQQPMQIWYELYDDAGTMLDRRRGLGDMGQASFSFPVKQAGLFRYYVRGFMDDQLLGKVRFGKKSGSPGHRH